MAYSRIRAIATQQADKALRAVKSLVRRRHDVALSVLDPDLVRGEPDDGLVGRDASSGGSDGGGGGRAFFVVLVEEEEEATGAAARLRLKSRCDDVTRAALWDCGERVRGVWRGRFVAQ